MVPGQKYWDICLLRERMRNWFMIQFIRCIATTLNQQVTGMDYGVPTPSACRRRGANFSQDVVTLQGWNLPRRIHDRFKLTKCDKITHRPYGKPSITHQGATSITLSGFDFELSYGHVCNNSCTCMCVYIQTHIWYILYHYTVLYIHKYVSL